MISPEEMFHIQPRFAKAGLTARYIAADDPESEDDEIEIFAGDVDTRVKIQICLIGGGYAVNEYRGEDSTLVMIHRGEFRVFRKAVDRAIEVVKAKEKGL